MAQNPQKSRREFIAITARGAALAAVGGVVGKLLSAKPPEGGEYVWQIDPAKCIQCGKCATNCVLNPSAVKCFHAFDICGYCDLCTGYFDAQPNSLNTGAENQLCPVAALERKYVEDPYYEYKIKRDLCIGCAKCVKGCNTYGNGSLYLQIDHHVCVRCNQCSIAKACPADAIKRVPAKQAYIANKIRTA